MDLFFSPLFSLREIEQVRDTVFLMLEETPSLKV